MYRLKFKEYALRMFDDPVFLTAPIFQCKQTDIECIINKVSKSLS